MTSRFRLCFLIGVSAVVAWAQGGGPTVTAVVNSADFSGRLSPGLIVAVYGTNFGSGPTSSVTMSVGGKAAAIVAVTPSQVAAQIPVDVPAGTTNLTVTVGGATSAAFATTLDAVAPTLSFSTNGSGPGVALIRTSANVNITNTLPAKPGDSLVVYGIGFGATNPVTPTGSTGTGANPTASPMTLTVGGVPAMVLYAGSTPGNLGLYQVNFTVPAGLQGTQPLAVTIAGRSSPPVGLPLSGITSVVSNASFGSVGVVAPGSIVSVFANGIGTTDQTIGFPATAFQGVSVSFNGIAAPLFHLTASAGQIDLLVPYELPTSGTATVQLKTAAGTSLNFPITLAPAAPGLYFLADPSTKARFNVLAQFNATAWLVLPDATATALKILGSCKAANVSPLALCGEPAVAGDYLVLYATGLGKATPNGDPNGPTLRTGDTPSADGSILYQTIATPIVTVGGFPAKVVFSGIAPGFPGLYQIDIQVPTGVSGDDVPLSVSIGGSPADIRTLAVRAQ